LLTTRSERRFTMLRLRKI